MIKGDLIFAARATRTSRLINLQASGHSMDADVQERTDAGAKQEGERRKDNLARHARRLRSAANSSKTNRWIRLRLRRFSPRTLDRGGDSPMRLRVPPLERGQVGLDHD